MVLYRYLRNVRHTLALSLGFGLALVGPLLAIRMLINEFEGVTAYESILGISSPYFMLIGFLIPLFLFFKRRKTRYYTVAVIGLFISIILYVMDFFNACECDYIVEDDISVCQWSVGLFLGMLILKKLE